MEYIGKHISILKKPEEISIVILASADKVKRWFLFAWLIAFTIGGVLIFSQTFIVANNGLKIYLIVWLAFWAYFEFKMIRVLQWRSSGKEIIKLRDKQFFIKRSIGGKGKINVYDTEFIKDLRLMPISSKLMESINNSYWVIAGEKIVFEYYGKTISFGLQIPDDEAAKLLKFLKSNIKS